MEAQRICIRVVSQKSSGPPRTLAERPVPSSACAGLTLNIEPLSVAQLERLHISADLHRDAATARIIAKINRNPVLHLVRKLPPGIFAVRLVRTIPGPEIEGI